MKDSGISWVGEIPKEWLCIKAKNIIKSNDGGVWGNEPTSTENDKIVLRSTEQTIDGKWIIEEPAKRDLSKIPYKNCLIKPNDLLITKSSGSSLHIGKTTLADDYFTTNECYYSNFLQRIRLQKSYYPLYAWFIFNAVFVREQFAYMQNSTSGLGNINSTDIENIIVPIPTLDEQQRIAEFLDRECGKIDGLKADIQAQIDTLEQYKRSVIAEAVTHGLNPSAPMKDSRISWVGDIPQNWEIKRLKYFFKFCKGLPITKDNLIDQGLPVISYGQIHAKTNNGVDVRSHLLRFVDFSYQTFYPLSQVMRGDFVFADTSEDYEGCGNCVYKRNDSLLFAGYHTIIAHSIVESDNRFFAYLFQTDIWRKQIREKVSGVKVFSITQKTLSNTYLILPPLDEQQEIADYLDNKCAAIEQIIADKKSQIETLDGYKKSLIYEYVTGKKEVV